MTANKDALEREKFEAWWAGSFGQVLELTGDEEADASCRIAKAAASQAWSTALSHPAGEAQPVATAQIGVSDEADFEGGTWTFKMPRGYHVSAGEYWIVPKVAAPPSSATGAQGLAAELDDLASDMAYEANCEGDQEKASRALVIERGARVLAAAAALTDGLLDQVADAIGDPEQGYDGARALLAQAAPAQGAQDVQSVELELYRMAYGPTAPTEAAMNVLAERQRQISAEGWTPEHDDQHIPGTLAQAAVCYIDWNGWESEFQREVAIPVNWPWAAIWWKPSDDRRNLVKAGALILAEIERLDRAASQADKRSEP